MEILPGPLGVGIAMSWGETAFLVLTVLGYGNENHLYLTCGALRDIQQDRLSALDACNRLHQADASSTFYLHDAELGWDILAQQTFPVQLLLDVPQFFANSCSNLPIVTEQGRKQFGDRNLGGSPYRWNSEDLQRLFIRSMM
jgi:hypothetical protein